MTVDLWILVSAALLQWALIMSEATASILTNGMGWAFGNRDVEGRKPAWARRAGRASSNLQENLILFAILVLVVHAAGKGSWLSALGAEIFLGARILHALVYIAGIPMVRTLLWAVSIGGMGAIAAALFL